MQAAVTDANLAVANTRYILGFLSLTAVYSYRWWIFVTLTVKHQN